MSRFFEKLKVINAEWNDLPRRLLWIVILIGCLFLVLLAFPYVAPFAIAALFAWMIDPLVKRIAGWLGGSKTSRNLISGLLVAILAGAVIVSLLLLITKVFDEVRALILVLPGWISQASTDVIAWIEGLDLEWDILQSSVEEALLRLLTDLTSMLTTFASRAASTVARGAWQAVSLLPQGVLFVVLTLMGTFYMSADKQRIFGFLGKYLPEKYLKRSDLFRASILRAILGQIRSALIMLVVTFAELSIGFTIMGLDYAILFALFIAVLDALPVIGAGLFLIPMLIYGIVASNVTLAVGAGVLYLTTIIVRQLLEPRIIGRQLGLYPLATMMAMYAGLKVMGFLGMLLGPLMLLLCKVALTADNEENDGPVERKPLLRIPKRKKKGAP